MTLEKSFPAMGTVHTITIFDAEDPGAASDARSYLMALNRAWTCFGADSLISQIAMFLVIYVGMMLLGAMLISLDGVYDLKTNLTAAITCVSNVGPGFGAVGPMGNFAGYSVFSKLVLSLLMLAGRLEIYPILVLFSPVIWRRN